MVPSAVLSGAPVGHSSIGIHCPAISSKIYPSLQLHPGKHTKGHIISNPVAHVPLHLPLHLVNTSFTPHSVYKRSNDKHVHSKGKDYWGSTYGCCRCIC